MNKESIYGLTFEQLTAWLSDHGHKKFRASQVWEWLYRTRVTSFSEMTDVNKECIKLLEEHFVIQTLTEHVKQEAADGTIKFLFKLQDGNLIETVMMRHKYGISVCVTTQVGCNIGCSFCASGLLAKSRDLSSGEIVEQIMNVQLHLDKLEQGEVVSHVVVMGIGEPFDNFENMLDFLKVLMDHKGLAIAGRRITVSTSGLAHKIYEFTDTQLQVNLAISLHAPNNELRTQIMKINRGIPIEKLMKSLDYYLEKTNRRITIEYILLKDVNDHQEEAEQLADLLDDKKHRLYVNLIPYNPVDEHSQYQRSDKESVLSFYDTLKKRGINCKIRQEHGTDIDAACGQLRSKQIKKAEAK
ncbi:23S rRNA (adenine(2503)-C(2))-methyltransferase RlmN [Peribacillus simplex]|uniref:Probable dual-specificity RNA methyltransferase RlmN n=1 Tax=Peribacillus simplex TaxID=1478 RepID=A0AAN2PCB3_9BACI|nr:MULTISPECIES: 23S rRNA (adenine(2503)-C(2))-methyltransferase RlmN [Peribacillus]MBD8589660.1 23S rRNA (adenine(2503)-C(2))-methyltransferase RlmN [Peribacillus simplex]MCP1155915.1 23S rRNA (adenine(2503)-C(2))-methyltransferase RlmN [Peribacillus frigoritolerans]MCT1387882.1 23S rRNA (adenine(2503)-C(2))-methyltransferase RlmN [Peribacillus frigoritolerans]MDF1999765.1 23S rRNA (adenine(2503)-C(2))-methyltransferase RlmN [Peribacillus frigoritolerans]MEA3576303.1 23S rRNA (adenine(2503)-C